MFITQILIYHWSRALLPFLGSTRWLCEIWHWLNSRFLPTFQISEIEYVGPFACFSERSLCMSWEKPKMLFTEQNLLGSWSEISHPLCPEGALGQGLCLCFMAVKCHFELWFHRPLGVLKPQDGVGSWTISESSFEEFPLDVSGMLILWLAHAFDPDCEPWTFYRSFSFPLLLIDLQLLCSPLCLWGKSVVRRKRQCGLTEKAQVWCRTDLRGSATFQLCDCRASFSRKWKMEPIIPVLKLYLWRG